jgi:hypothetical protein
MKKEKNPAPYRGVVNRISEESSARAADASARGGDVTFSPDYTVTSTTDGGGNVLPSVEVILCF